MSIVIIEITENTEYVWLKVSENLEEGRNYLFILTFYDEGENGNSENGKDNLGYFGWLWTGNVIIKSVPIPSLLSTLISPPCSMIKP